MPTILPMLPPPHQPRPVDAEWKCQRSGDCCTKPKEVVMTDQERVLLMQHSPVGVQTHWRELENGMWGMQAGPCPFFLFNSCSVYAVRPYNCRRFACMRPDPKTEPFEMGGVLGCLNLEIRVRTSRIARRLAALIQRRAMVWARAHGWSDSM